MPKLILSPVGTSILTNLSGNDRAELNKYANAKELSVEIKLLIDSIAEKASSQINIANSNQLRAMSAELNGIFGIYDGLLPKNSQDVHWLIVTDTYQGSTTGNILKEYLSRSFPATQILQPERLSTKDKSHFQSGIKHLIQWCDQTLPGYKDAGYEIIFNLTGGFKSLQGYLSTIGMFYADKIVYIFEQSTEMIIIPRLPIRLETELFEKYAAIFLQLSQTQEGLTSTDVNNIPEIMLDEYGSDKFILSDCGSACLEPGKKGTSINNAVRASIYNLLSGF